MHKKSLTLFLDFGKLLPIIILVGRYSTYFQIWTGCKKSICIYDLTPKLSMYLFWMFSLIFMSKWRGNGKNYLGTLAEYSDNIGRTLVVNGSKTCSFTVSMCSIERILTANEFNNNLVSLTLFSYTDTKLNMS